MGKALSDFWKVSLTSITSPEKRCAAELRVGRGTVQLISLYEMRTTIAFTFVLGTVVLSAQAQPVTAKTSPNGTTGSIPKVAEGATDSGINLPIPAPPVLQVTAGEGPLRNFGKIHFNKNATEVRVELPADAAAEAQMYAAAQSGVRKDGTWILTANDAKVEGKKAKLEVHPGNARVGYWTEASDAVSWEIKPGNYGNFYAELTYSQAAKPSRIHLKVGPNELEAKLPSTGSWYTYQTINLGRIYLEEKPQTVRVKGLSKQGGAVMNFKSLVLRPAPEGELEIQKPQADGSFELLAKQATAYGIKLRYEPQPHKNCLGYWVHPTDYAEWFIEVPQKGQYRLLLTQGCGKNEGGSAVDLLVGDSQVTFKVEETGGFQKWREREVGLVTLAAGTYPVRLRPRNKTNVAVMDVQKLLLRPVE